MNRCDNNNSVDCNISDTNSIKCYMTTTADDYNGKCYASKTDGCLVCSQTNWINDKDVKNSTSFDDENCDKFPALSSPTIKCTGGCQTKTEILSRNIIFSNQTQITENEQRRITRGCRDFSEVSYSKCKNLLYCHFRIILVERRLSKYFLKVKNHNYFLLLLYSYRPSIVAAIRLSILFCSA